MLKGGGGVDRLIGDAGRDIMVGGAQRDIFDFDSYKHAGIGSTRDRITDFQRGIDDIDLSTIDANGTASGSGAFKFQSGQGADFTGVRGQLHFHYLNRPGTANDRTIIEGDLNGDRRADFQIEFVGLKALTKADFIL